MDSNSRLVRVFPAADQPESKRESRSSFGDANRIKSEQTKPINSEVARTRRPSRGNATSTSAPTSRGNASSAPPAAARGPLIDSESKVLQMGGTGFPYHNPLHSRHPYSEALDASSYCGSAASSPAKSFQVNNRHLKSKISAPMVFGLLTGIILGLVLSSWVRRSILRCDYPDMSACCNPFLRSPNAASRGFASALRRGDFADPCSDEALGGATRDPRKKLLFVGVMTANKYLNTRAPAVFRSWGDSIPGKMAFFSASSASSQFDIPIVGLKGVDDSYPPQKKSFMMLKYIHDHCLDKFEWFMRADDDVFIRGEKLERFLRSINSSKPQFIGQAGLGNKEEFGLLSLEYDENFCMGGPGMIFSRETLRRVVPNIKDCLKNLYSTHEDVEVGRCVRKHAGIPCTWSYEMQNFFYHNSSGNEAFTGNLRKKEVHRAITLHPVKQHRYQHYVSQYFLSLRIQELLHKIILSKRILRDMSIALGEQTSSTPDVDANHQGHPPSLMKWTTTSRSMVRDWDFLARSIYSYHNLNPRRGLETDLRVAMDTILMQVMTMINENARQRGRTIDFKDILYGYSRVNPMHGADYVLDLLLVYRKHKGRKMTVPVRRHAYLQQTFGDVQFREAAPPSQTSTPREDSSPSLFRLVQEKLFPVESVGPVNEDRHGPIPRSSTSETIHFVVPLSGRFNTLLRFMTNFEKVCLASGEDVKLVLVLFQESNSDPFVVNRVVQLIDGLSIKYPTHELKIVRSKGPFNRGLGLEIGSTSFGPEALLFFCDVDMLFTRGFLERLRRAAIRHERVYFPIVYSQYDPRWVYNSEDVQAETDLGHLTFPNEEEENEDSDLPKHLRNPYLVSKNSGYWRQFGFGIVALFNSDFRRVGGFDTSIQGWGKEDVDLYTKFVTSNLTIFRSTDPGIVHVYHEIHCDAALPSSQYTMCVGTKASSYASSNQMAAKVLQTKDLLLSAEDREAGFEAAEPGDIAVQVAAGGGADGAVFDEIKEVAAAQ